MRRAARWRWPAARSTASRSTARSSLANGETSLSVQDGLTLLTPSGGAGGTINAASGGQITILDGTTLDAATINVSGDNDLRGDQQRGHPDARAGSDDRCVQRGVAERHHHRIGRPGQPHHRQLSLFPDRRRDQLRCRHDLQQRLGERRRREWYRHRSDRHRHARSRQQRFAGDRRRRRPWRSAAPKPLPSWQRWSAASARPVCPWCSTACSPTRTPLVLAPGLFGNVKLNDTIIGGTVVNAGGTIGFGSVRLQTVTFEGPLDVATTVPIST